MLEYITATVIYLVATMSPDVGGNGAIYVWTTPTFGSFVECQQWTQGNVEIVFEKLAEEFANTRQVPQGLWCIEESKLVDYMNSYVNPKTSGNDI